MEQLETSRQKLLAELEKEDKGIFHTKPAPDKWCIAQVFYHLNSSESISINYVQKKMLGGDSIKKTGVPAAFRSMLVKTVLRSGYKLKAPKLLGDMPEEVNYHKMVDSWNETRIRLSELIHSMPETLIEREVYYHPLAGRMNLLHMLEFFKDHFDHHLTQIDRLKKQ